MWLPLLPMLSLIAPPSPVVEAAPAAQARLASLLVAADSIDSLATSATSATFAIERSGEAYTIVATTSDTGAIMAVAVTDAGPATSEGGALSWLGPELVDATAIATVLTSDGAVTLVTSEGRYYRAIPSHGANAAVEARWAAAWDHDDADE
jgi:hypothetical protein